MKLYVNLRWTLVISHCSQKAEWGKKKEEQNGLENSTKCPTNI